MFVGISERTNEAGAAFLAKAFGSSLPVIPVQVVRIFRLRCYIIAIRFMICTPYVYIYIYIYICFGVCDQVCSHLTV